MGGLGRNKEQKFTTLLHHVDEAALLQAFRRINAGGIVM
jgi:hypothetical protein